MSVAAKIERNRIALLRIVFCWLSLAGCINAHGRRPLPRRVAAWIEELLSKAERASFYLIIAVFYNQLIDRQQAASLEPRIAFLTATKSRGAQTRLTINTIKLRLQHLQRVLVNADIIARSLAIKLVMMMFIHQLNGNRVVTPPRPSIHLPNCATRLAVPP